MLPDTPRWYYARGHFEKADQVVCNLFDALIDDPRVQDMKQSILANIALENQDGIKFRVIDLIWDKSALRVGRRIRISFLILSLQQMMGKVVNLRMAIIILLIYQRNQLVGLLQHFDLFPSGALAVPCTIARSNNEHFVCFGDYSFSVHY